MSIVKVEVVGRVSGVLDIPAPVVKSLASGQYTNVVVDSVSVLEGFPEIAALIAEGLIELEEVDPAVPPPPLPDRVTSLEDSSGKGIDRLSLSDGAEVLMVANLRRMFGSALCEDIEMALVSTEDLAEDVSAAELSTAAAGEFSRNMTVLLQTAAGRRHRWAELAPTITPAEAVADPEVGAPTVASRSGWSPPSYYGGVLDLRVTFDTDAGLTKTYAPGDSVTVTIDVSAFTIFANVANLVKTFNVVA